MRRIHSACRVPALLCVAVIFIAGTSNAVAVPVAWAVGAAGTLVMSADMGTTWTPQTSGTSQDLHGLDFFGPLHGVAVGANGTLLRSTNGGSTWLPAASGVTTTLYDVVLSGPNTGVAVGAGGNGTITVTGGASWIPIVFSLSPNFRALASTGVSTIVAVGEDRRWSQSNDGGITWSATAFNVGQAANPPLNWLGATGAGGTSVVAVGADQNGGMYTRYNGTLWSPAIYIGSFAPTPTPFGFELFDVAFTGASIVAVGKDGVVTRSDNGGLTWTTPTSVAPFDLFDVEFLDALNGLAVGADGNVIRTTDGGLTWSVPINAADATLYALVFVDANIASVAEPASSLLVAFALLGLMARRRLLR
jgi:photosystem II stability/assembly factor-like uncharacterized protein